MHEYLNNLLPRLRTLSKTLNQVEIFADKEWVFVDANSNNPHLYTFLRDKRLIVSVNGENKIGKWEILPTGKLLIEFSKEPPMLLENAFVNNAVLVLKKNGKNDQPFILFDKIKIPDGNIVKYLLNLEKTIIQIPDYPYEPDDDLDPLMIKIILVIVLFFIIIFFLFKLSH
jgi:hypothetical protein